MPVSWIGNGDRPWHAPANALLFLAVWVGLGVLVTDESLADRLLIGVPIALVVVASGGWDRRRRVAGKERVAWVPLVAGGLVIGAVVLATRDDEEDVDYAAICRQATAPVATADDLRSIARAIERGLTTNGNYQPTPDEVARFRAAAFLLSEARDAAAPYAIPTEFQGNLPSRPDTTKVVARQAELRTACA